MKIRKIDSKLEAGKATSGTSLKDKIYGVTYDQLVDKFGEPSYTPQDSGDGKVNFEWVFEFGDEIFTIYDWKSPSEEFAKDLVGTKEGTPWHVGGKSYAGDFVDYIESAVQ